MSMDNRPTVEITRDQLECWAGRELSDEEVARLDECIPNSSIPQAIGAIVDGFTEVDSMEAIMEASQCGYICKRCGGPSPLGVGYVDDSAGAAGRSAGLTVCGCGYSAAACSQCGPLHDSGDGTCMRHGKVIVPVVSVREWFVRANDSGDEQAPC